MSEKNNLWEKGSKHYHNYKMFIIRKAIIKAMKNIESEVSPHNIIKVLGFYLCEITFKHCPDPFVATNLLLQIVVNKTEEESLKIIKRDV